MIIVDGKKIAKEVLAEVKKEVSDKNLKLSLGAVLVGDNSEFKKFVELKSKAAEKSGISFTMYRFPEDIGMEELKKDMLEVIKWSDGVLVELPLPEHIDQQKILNMVPVEKDVDVLSDEAQKLFYDNKSKVGPPAMEALKIVLERAGVSLKGKKAAVFGQGVLIGKPVSHWLESQGAEVFRIRSKTENSEQLSRQADIIVAGVGKPGLIKEEMVKEGAVVIDFGYGKNTEGKMVGDVEIKVLPKADIFTPVPGGMGPILIVTVLKNLIKLNS